MEDEVIFATTHVDSHGDRLAVSALEDMAAGLREVAVRWTIEHDPTVLPLGRIARARVVELADGEHALLVQPERFEALREITLPGGSQAIEFGVPGHDVSFAVHRHEKRDEYYVAYDRVNFESQDDIHAFLTEVRAVAPFEERVFGRKSLIPDPQLILQLPAAFLTFEATRRIGGKVLDRLGDDIAEDAHRIYQFATTAAVALLKRAIPKGRPVTCVYEVDADPKVQFVVRGDDAQTFEAAIDLERLRELWRQAVDLRDALDAIEVQYLYDGGEWRFNYLLTGQGRIIGTPIALEEANRRMALLIEEAQRLEALEDSEDEVRTDQDG